MLPPRERSLARAAARPLNLAVLAIMLVIALVWAPWLVALAIPVYGVLVAASYRPPQSQPVVSREIRQAPELDGISSELRPRVRHALREQEAILRQLAALPVQPPDLAIQVRQLGRDVGAAARRVSEVDDYLRGVDPDALRARLAAQEERAGKAAAALAEQVELVESLTVRREALDDELEHVDAVLGTIRARLVTAGLGLDEAGRLRDEVDDVRELVSALADGLAEAYERRALGP
jgi:predicted  nucleic acid-binding Zn-ribbon protein